MTPIVTRKARFLLRGCEATVLGPRRRYYNKINAGKPMFPYSFICFLGDIKLTYRYKTEDEARKKLAELVRIRSIGRFHGEGMGRVQWISGSFDEKENSRVRRSPSPRVRIRKGLPHDLSEDAKRLIRFALLHDFVNTSKHQSKIYVEPHLPDLDYLRKHHDKADDPFISLFQKYDQLAAIITRGVRSPRPSRYNWRSTKNVDFGQLAKEIEEVSDHIWKLYNYIYKSKELGRLNESLQHGHTSLRNHLLLVANLIVRDFRPKGLEGIRTLCLNSVGQSKKREGSEIDCKGFSTIL